MVVKNKLSDLLKCLWLHLSKRRKIQFVALLGLMLVSAFAEVMSLSAVIPFLAVLIEPEKVFSYSIVAQSAEVLGIKSAGQMIIPLTLTFSFAALFAGMIRLLLLWSGTRIAYGSASDLSIDVYRKSLYQPYSVHLTRNSSEIISAVTYKVNDVAFGVLQAFPSVISATVLFIAILCTLIVISPEVALMATFGFGVSYGLVLVISKRRLRMYSECIAREQTQIFKALQEGVGSIRDVLLDGTQPVFCDIYRKADVIMRRAQGNNLFINVSPRYVMEAIGMVLIAGLAYYLSTQPGGVAKALPVLGALALGAQRILPALQQIYSGLASMQASHASLVAVLDLLNQPISKQLLHQDLPVLKFQKSIVLRGIGFSYENNTTKVLNDLNLTILKGSCIGILGPTGSGKSTLLDILMGLLEPTEGEMLIDGSLLTDLEKISWQRKVAHVPQDVYLTDATVAENIALGVPFDKINMERVRYAAQQAQIASLIESRPEGYLSLLGERGSKLSGGQKQRIGIARALYKQASILIFDEATSALDNNTEKSVMHTIEGLSESLTILIVAHRLTTLRKCTQIIELSDGRVKRVGSYQAIVG